MEPKSEVYDSIMGKTANCRSQVTPCPGRVTSTVLITDLSAEDQGSVVTCTAHNSVLIQPQTASVVLDVIGNNADHTLFCRAQCDKEPY